MTIKQYDTAGVVFQFNSAEPIEDTAFFPSYLTANKSPDYIVSVLRQPLPKAEGKPVFRDGHRSRVEADGVIFDYTYYSEQEALGQVPYACAVKEGGRITLSIDFEGRLWDRMLFDALLLPDLFLKKQKAIIHTAFVDYRGKAILFAGQKKQGKSTQAALWKQYKNADIINGDRAVIGIENGMYTASGIPFCGSSNISINTKKQIRTVVFPEKADAAEVVPLSAIAAFKKLIGCICYSVYDRKAADRAFQFTENLVQTLTCVSLRNRADQESVDALYRFLYESHVG